jgi:hypothetical protein
MMKVQLKFLNLKNSFVSQGKNKKKKMDSIINKSKWKLCYLNLNPKMRSNSLKMIDDLNYL